MSGVNINNKDLKNILGELIMYQEKEIERLEIFLNTKCSFASIANDTRNYIRELEERKNTYRNLIRKIA